MAMRFRKHSVLTDATAPVYDPAALPVDLAVCLETMTVIQRTPADNGEPRAVVQLDASGWIHTRDESRAQLLRRWPALTESQISRALRHITARVRQSAMPLPTQRRSWAMDW